MALTAFRLDEIDALVPKLMTLSYRQRELITYALAFSELVNEVKRLKKQYEPQKAGE